MLKITLGGSDVNIVERFRYSKERVTTAAIEKMTALLTKLQQKAQARASGPYSTTGALESSILPPDVYISGYKIIGNIGWGEGVPYAQALEFGGKGPYPITATKKALLMLIEGEKVYARQIMHPPAPKKAFMSQSAEEMRAEIAEGIQEAVTGAISG